VAASLAAPLAAQAQAPAPGTPWYARDDRGVQAQALVGVQLQPGAASDFLGTGVAYGVLVTLEPWPVAAFELGYQGSFYRTTTLATQAGRDLAVFENGGYAALKASPRVGAVEPYALAGAGFSLVRVVEEQGVVTRLADDTLALLPVALGADYHFLNGSAEGAERTHLTAGLRASYVFVFDNTFVPVTARGADRLIFAALFGAQF